MKTINIDDIQKIGDVTTITLRNSNGDKFTQDIKPGGKLLIPPGYEEAMAYGKEGEGNKAKFWKTPLSPVKKNDTLSFSAESLSF